MQLATGNDPQICLDTSGSDCQHHHMPRVGTGGRRTSMHEDQSGHLTAIAMLVLCPAVAKGTLAAEYEQILVSTSPDNPALAG